MRDLDYINPRQKAPSCALPPEIRRKLGLDKSSARSSSCPPPAEEHEVLYKGSANAEAKIGQSGAGTNWHNPNGHAFVRRRSGAAMSQQRARSFAGAGASIIGTGGAESGRSASTDPRRENGLPPSVERVRSSSGLPEIGRKPSREAIKAATNIPGGSGRSSRAPSREKGSRSRASMPPLPPTTREASCTALTSTKSAMDSSSP